MKYKNIPFKLLLVSLVFSVLAFGMRATWSRLVVETLLYLGLGGFLIQAWQGKRACYRVPGLLPLGLILVLMIFQIIPLPIRWIAWLSSGAGALYRETAVITGGLDRGTLSITPDLTRMELFRFGGMVVAYGLSVQLLTEKKALQWTITAVALFASALALFGIVQHFTAGGAIYWFREIAGSHFGPFVYRNHFAGLMVLLFPISFALLYFYRPQVRYGSFRESLLEMLTGREVNLRLLYGLSALVIATSVFVTLSRGGVMALCVSALLFSLMLLTQKGSSKRGLVVVLFFALVLLSVSWFGWDALIERFSKTVNEEGELWNGRFTYWEDTKGIASDFRWWGSGFGTFVSIFPAYQSLFVGGQMVSHAHGDYYELLATGGGVGTLLFLWFGAALLLQTLPVYRKRRDRYSRILYLALGAGLLGFMAQAYAEFSFYSGAGALWFYFVAALFVSAAHTRLKGKEASYLVPVSHHRAVILGMGFVVGLGLIFSLHHNVTRLKAEYAFAGVRGASMVKGAVDDESEMIFDAAQEAVRLNPWSAKYQLALASVLYQRGDTEGSRSHFARAAALNPASADLFHRFARYGRGLDRAAITQCLEQARDRNIMDPDRYKFSAASYFKEGRREEAMADLVHAMEITPSKRNFDECVKIMIFNGVSMAEVASRIPDTGIYVLSGAAFFKRWGETELSDAMIDTAYALFLGPNKQSVGLYFRLCRLLMREGDLSRALGVIQAAARYYPMNERVYIVTGDIYVKMDIGYRARDEYRKALSINPRNKRVKKKMAAIKGSI